MSEKQPWLGLSIEERLFGGIDRTDTEACWLYTGYCGSEGYGQLSYAGNTNWRAHRLVHELYVGPIPAGLQVDHTCHNESGCRGGSQCPHRRCVNPRHLEAVDAYTNMVRSPNTRPGRAARENTCRHGHEYTPDNTYWLPRGVRECRQCLKRRRLAYEARLRTARLESA